MAFGWLAAATIGSGLLGAGASIFGASEQVSAEQQAIQAQEQMYQEGLKTQKGYLTDASNTLNPFIQGGQGDYALYNYLTAGTPLPAGQFAPNGAAAGSLTAPFTAASLPYTPGYQFTLGQGLKSTQNSYAAQGLGSSGTAEKGAAQFATGLAQNTYNNQFQNYLAQNAQIANILLGGVGQGSQSANTLASLYGAGGNAALGGAVTTGQGVASSTAGIGNAYAGGAAGVANSLTGGINNLLLYNLLSGGQSNAVVPAAVSNIGVQNDVNDQIGAYLSGNSLTNPNPG